MGLISHRALTVRLTQLAGAKSPALQHRRSRAGYRVGQPAGRISFDKLTVVVSSITGVTGMAIIKAILHGQRDPLQLAKLRNDKCKRTEAEIARALYGNWRAEHLSYHREP